MNEIYVHIRLTLNTIQVNAPKNSTAGCSSKRDQCPLRWQAKKR